MTDLQLHKFVNHVACDNWRDDDSVGVWVYPSGVAEFRELVPSEYFEGGVVIQMSMNDDTVSIDLTELCEYYGIDLDEVFD